MRRLGLLLTLAVAVAVTAVPGATARSPRSTHDVLPVFVSTAHSTSVDFFSWEKGQKRVSLAVFAQPSRPGDLLPVASRVAFTFPGGQITPEPNRARRLLVAGNAAIYAEPTKQGGVCYFLAPNGGGSCVEALLHGALPAVTRGQVWGLMDNGAKAVDVRVPGSGWQHAALGRNAFYLRLPKHVPAPAQIVVHEKNGDRHVFDVKRCHAEKISALSGLSPLGPPPC